MMIKEQIKKSSAICEIVQTLLMMVNAGRVYIPVWIT